MSNINQAVPEKISPLFEVLKNLDVKIANLATSISILEDRLLPLRHEAPATTDSCPKPGPGVGIAKPKVTYILNEYTHRLIELDSRISQILEELEI